MLAGFAQHFKADFQLQLPLMRFTCARLAAAISIDFSCVQIAGNMQYEAVAAAAAAATVGQQ